MIYLGDIYFYGFDAGRIVILYINFL